MRVAFYSYFLLLLFVWWKGLTQSVIGGYSETLPPHPIFCIFQSFFNIVWHDLLQSKAYLVPTVSRRVKAR